MTNDICQLQEIVFLLVTFSSNPKKCEKYDYLCCTFQIKMWNLLMEIVDHLAQFISVEKDTRKKHSLITIKETTQNGRIKTFWMIYQSKNGKMIYMI